MRSASHSGPSPASPRRAGPRVPTLHDRSSGVLLHPTSLPGRHGSGDLGGEARAFVDFVAAAGQRWWQMLPVGPPGYGESPYAAQSAFAGSPTLVSLDDLVRDGLLDESSVAPRAPLCASAVEYPAMAAHRARLLEEAFEAWSRGHREDRPAYE